MKIWKKIVRLLVLLVLILPVVAMIAIQIPAVQTFAVGKLSDSLTRNLDGAAHVGKVYFSYPNSLILKDVDIIQGADDTVAHVGKLLIKLKATSLVLDEAVVRRFSLEDGRVNIHRLDDSTTNLSRLLAPWLESPSKTILPWSAFRLDRFTLKHIDVTTDELALQDINLDARKLRYSSDGATARIENLTLRKGDELAVQRLSVDAKYDTTGVTLRDFHYVDDYSSIDADLLGLSFQDFSDFSHFTDKVGISASLQPSRLDLRTIQPFMDLGGRQLALVVAGKVEGTVANLRSDRFRVTSDSGRTQLELNFQTRGLPDLNQARINANVVRGETTTQDLADILSGIMPGFNKASLTQYAPGETLSLTAHADGTPARLQTTAQLQAGTMGSAAVNAILNLASSHFQAEGTVSTSALEIGRILGSPSLGSLTCHTDLSFSTGKKNLSLDVEQLAIDHFTFNGYDYGGIVASASLEDGYLQADLWSNDPNIAVTGHGNAMLGGKKAGSHYQIDLDVRSANLHALNIDPRDSSIVSFSLAADIEQTPEGAFLGTADIRNLQASLPDQTYRIGDISVESQQFSDSYLVTLESVLLRGEYTGNIFVKDFAQEAIHLMYQDNLEHLFGGKHTQKEDVLHPDHFGSIDLHILDLQPFTGFFGPKLFVSPQSHIRAELQNIEVVCDLSSELTAYDRLLLHNIQLRCLTEGERIRAFVNADRLQFGGVLADNLDIDATADSLIDLRLAFHNEDDSGNRANLHTRFSFPTPEKDEYPVRVDLLPSELAIANHPWSLSPAVVRYRDKNIRIDNFSVSNGEQSLLVDGVVSESVTDTVRVMLNDFDLGTANSFLSKDFNLQGLLTGRGEAFAVLGPEKGLLFDMHARYVSVRDIEMGHFVLQSKWDDPEKQFKILLNNTLNGRHPIVANAAFQPADKTVSADVTLDSLALGFAEPLLTGLFTDMGGSLSGHIKASGPLNKISISSEGARLNNVAFTLDYTRVPYIADGPFSISDAGVTFDNVRLTDRFGHEGRLSGGLPYDHLKDIRLNIRLDLDDMMALNTTGHDNESFYGRAFADGTVRVMGSLNKINLNLNITPVGNSSIHIPVGASATKSHSLLTFINNEKKVSLIDSLILARQNPEKTEQSHTDINVNLRLNATPEAEIQVEVDKNTGDILKARGNGMIGITVTSSLFDIKGDYKVDSGSYHFGMLGITSRDFSIDPGGTISFNGDVMDSDLDMTATYRTKASINPLIADSSSVSTRRTVDCRIILTGKLSNPEIRFNIDIPDLDPTTQSRVEGALNTEDKRMKQTLALLVSGGFVPDEQSGIVNSTTLLFSNASEMMSSQLNKIFHQLDIPIDLGFNYQPSENGRDMFDVAVSTQLFNNRVIINGNIGNRQYMSSSNSDIVGDLDIEIKLNRQGQLRLTLFSHSADQYSNYLDQSQRNGAGIVYQEDFNSFKELWRKIFHIKNDERQALPDPNAPRPVRTE